MMFCATTFLNNSLMAAQTDMCRNRAVFVTYLHAATAIFVEILM